MDHREGDGRGPPAGRLVYKDRGPGDGGVALQTPGCPYTNRGELRIVPQPPPKLSPVNITDDTMTAVVG